MSRAAHGAQAQGARCRQALVDTLLPVFSQTKVDGCFADIMVPSWTNNGVAADPPQAEPWERRAPTLFFRGSTTGGFASAATDFAGMHRQRLVAAAANDSRMDVRFVDFVQCSPEACAAMEARYGRAARAPEEAAWAHKYVMILDGNTFSSRLMRTLRSGSLVLRAGLFREWFDERLEPFLHYLPVRRRRARRPLQAHAWSCDGRHAMPLWFTLHAALGAGYVQEARKGLPRERGDGLRSRACAAQVRLDFSDLQQRLAWALTHDAEAAAMAERTAVHARRHIRVEDISCYWYRLLLEYAALLQQ